LSQLCRSVPDVDLVTLLAVTDAQCHASDVHIEPRPYQVEVRSTAAAFERSSAIVTSYTT